MNVIIPKPMLASVPGPSETLEALAGKGWSFEPKIDGVRVIVQRRGDTVRLWTRTGRDIADQFPEVVASIRAAGGPRVFLIDGELELVGDKPLSVLTGRVNTTQPRRITVRAAADPAWVIAFDILDVGLNRPRLPQKDRRERLIDTLAAIDALALEPIESGGADLFKRTREAGEEGVIAKNPAAMYVPGYRTRSWLKFKHRYTLTAIAVQMNVSRTYTMTGTGRPFRNITVALLKGQDPVMVGDVGTGFTDQEMVQLFELLTDGGYPVVEITVMGRTKDGLREPVFIGLRTDLNFEACGIAQLSEIPVV